MSKPTACEYADGNEGDGMHGPCTGPIEQHDCSYSSELASEGDEVRQCHCCTSCARECYLNV